MHLKANKLKYDRSQYRVVVPNPGPITLCPRRSGNACVTGIVTVQESKEAAAARVALRGRNVGWKELEYEKEEEMMSMCVCAVGRVELQFSVAPASVRAALPADAVYARTPAGGEAVCAAEKGRGAGRVVLHLSAVRVLEQGWGAGTCSPWL